MCTKSQAVKKSTLYFQSAHVLTQVSMSTCEADLALTVLQYSLHRHVCMMSRLPYHAPVML